MGQLIKDIWEKIKSLGFRLGFNKNRLPESTENDSAKEEKVFSKSYKEPNRSMIEQVKVDPNSIVTISGLRKMGNVEEIPDKLKAKAEQEVKYKNSSIYCGNVQEGEQSEKFAAIINPSQTEDIGKKINIPKTLNIIRSDGKKEEILYNESGKIHRYKKYSNFTKDEKHPEYEFANTVYSVEFNPNGELVDIFYKNTEPTMDDKEQAQKERTVTIKVSDASYTPNAGYYEGFENVYPEEYTGVHNDSDTKTGFYITQELKHGDRNDFLNDVTFQMSEHYEDVENQYPKKIHISIPEAKGFFANRDIDYFLTEDGKNYRDGEGNIFSLQKIRLMAKGYGFKDPSESRYSRLYRAAHGVKKYDDKSYTIMPNSTKKIIEACERMEQQQEPSEQET